MNQIILHPAKNFLDARNPSSPFQHRISSCFSVWKYIENNVMEHPTDTNVGIFVNGKLYQHWYKRNLFNLIKHHWGL